MSRYCLHSEDWCGFSTASVRARELATAAVDGDGSCLQKASLEDIAEALDTLESCRRHDCEFHSGERHARAFLQALIEADDGSEIEEARHAAE
jgi:hypothetical protein